MKEKFINEFAEMLEINPSHLAVDLNFKSLETWDSVNAMGLMALVDKCFSIQLSSQDIINLSSVSDIFALINSAKK